MCHRMKKRRLSRPACGLRLWVSPLFTFQVFEFPQILARPLTPVVYFVISAQSPSPFQPWWHFSQMSPAAMDWLSPCLEHIWLLRHWHDSCPRQECLASWHCPWEQVRRCWIVKSCPLQHCAIASTHLSSSLSSSAALTASLTWRTTPTCWSATPATCTGCLLPSIAARVPSRSPTSRLIIRTAHWHSGHHRF